MVNDIAAASAGETARLLETEGIEHAVAVADISLWSEAERVVAATVDALGALDVLVANAGVSIDVPFLEVREADLDRTFAVNVKGLFACGQAAARAMIRAGRGGHIVNVASIFAEACEAGASTYSASKGAVRTLTKAMGIELGPLGIHVNAVAPGYIPTGMNRMLEEEDVGQLQKSIPLARVGSPDEIAGVISFLTSPDACYMQGETVVVDGGWLLR